MNIKNFKIIGTLLFVASFFVSCGSGGKQSAGRRGGVKPYPVLQVQKRAITLTNTYPANLKGSQTVEIRPKVQGYIEKMLVDEGDNVKKGETLFVLDNKQFEQQVLSAKADIQAARAAVDMAKTGVKRLKPLVKKNIVSKYRLTSARKTLQSKQAALAQAKASLENAKVQLGYTHVKSPATGVIGNIPYRVGSLVNSNIQQPLTTVSATSKMYAYFSLSENELLQMTQSVAKEGGNKNLKQRINEFPKVNLLLTDNTTYNHKGTVRMASGLIDSGTGSVSFRAVFPNPNKILRSGASGQIQIPLSLHSVITIPKEATYEVQNKIFVYTVTDSNTVESTNIQTRELSTKKLYVIKKGLSNKQTIVLHGMGELRDGAKIKPQPVNADSLYQAMTVQNQPKSVADSASATSQL